jgi:hypothetical protein
MIIVKPVICNSSDLKPKENGDSYFMQKIINTIFLTENNGASHKHGNLQANKHSTFFLLPLSQYIQTTKLPKQKEDSSHVT